MTEGRRDTWIAIFLLLFCGAFFWASFDIEITNYGTIDSSLWPRIIIVALGLLSALLLFQSVAGSSESEGEQQVDDDMPWTLRYRNAFWIYGLFFLFLLTLPWTGMLIGGTAFVFLCLTAMGEFKASRIPLHLGIAVVSIGLMWSIFTWGLGVLLPQGEILQIY